MKSFAKHSLILGLMVWAGATAGLVGFWPASWPETKAAAVQVDPLIIDHQGLPRDIIKGSFKIINPNPHKVTIFTTTRNFDPEKGEQDMPQAATEDVSRSLANWISVSSMMLEMEPNETREISYEIKINLRAPEGAYHANMFFPHAASRSEAENLVNSAPKITVNVTVGNDTKERLQVASFKAPGVVLGWNAGFEATVNNTGNAPLKPKGELRIYNRNGEEVATMAINDSGEEVAPGQSKQFTAQWEKARGFGRYKAQIVLEFGDKQFQTYQDSMFFWLLPWPILLFLIMILSGVALLLVYTLHRAHIKRLRAQEEYFQKMMKQKVQQAKRAAIKKANQDQNKL